MNVNERLLNDFLRYHQRVKRQIDNRDKALIQDYQGHRKDRFYLRPLDSHYDEKQRCYVPHANTSWEFVLYSTPIVTVDRRGVGTLNDGGWSTFLTHNHIICILNQYCRGYWRFKYWRPNRWTQGIHVLNDVPFVNGLKIDMNEGTILDPPKRMKCVVNQCAEVKDMRRKLTVVKKLYAPLAMMHLASWRSSQGKNNPFEGVEAREPKDLFAETEPVVETYMWLVTDHRYRWHWSHYNPVAALNASLRRIGDKIYKQHLVEVEA